MAKICMECGQKAGWLSVNYAGLNLKQGGAHIFPDRISEVILPGDKQKDFLCADCANKRRMTCSVHGEIKGNLFGGNVPKCPGCAQEQAEQERAAEARRQAEIENVKTSTTAAIGGFAITDTKSFVMAEYEDKLPKCPKADAVDQAIRRLKEKAQAKGANAVINLKIATTEGAPAPDGTPIKVVVEGEAVVVVKTP